MSSQTANGEHWMEANKWKISTDTISKSHSETERRKKCIS